MTRPSWWTEADERQVALLHSLGSLGESEADAHTALVIMDMLDEMEPADPTQLGDAAPALAQWGREVLVGTGRRSALEKAAAWELAALQYERTGDEEKAKDARAKARKAILRRAA